MKIGWGKAIVTGLTLVTISGTGTSQAPAQDAGNSAFTVTGSIRSTFEIDDNGSLATVSPGTDLTFGTALGLTIGYETPRSTLTLDLGVTLQAEDLAAGTEDNGLADPSARLDYQLEGPDSLFSLSADYRKGDVANSFSFDSDADLINDVFLSSIGEIERFGGSVELSFGLQAPFGMDFELSRRERNYSNTVDPGLFDTTTDRARVTARLRPTETTTVRIYAEEERYEAKDTLFTDRRTRTVGTGLDYEINPVLTFSGEIGLVDVEETTIVMGAPVIETSSDYSIDASLTQELPNGTAAITLTRDVSTNIERTELGVERAMDVPSGQLSYGVGVSSGNTGSSVLTGFVDYVHEFPGAVMSIGAERTASINSDNDQVQRTRLNLAYDRDLTPTAGIVLQLGYLDAKDIGTGTASTGSRTDLSLTYRQELTEDWDWSVGYVGRRTETSAGTSATSNALVFSVGRSFSLRP